MTLQNIDSSFSYFLYFYKHFTIYFIINKTEFEIVISFFLTVFHKVEQEAVSTLMIPLVTRTPV